MQRAIADIAASPVPLLEKLDQLDDLTPPLFIDLSAAWTTRLTEKCRLHASDLNAALAAVSTLTASLIDRGIVADEVFPGSQLASAMATKNSKRDAFLRVLTQARKETASRAPGRMSDLMACREAVAQLTVQSSGAADACRARLDELDEELGSLATWEKASTRFTEALDRILSDGMAEPSTGSLVAVERTRDNLRRQFNDAKNALENKDNSESDVDEARQSFAAAEKAFQDERLRISSLATAHHPHLFLLHPSLRMSDADLGSDGLFVEGRHLDHFSDVTKFAKSRHQIRVATIHGSRCVLKEYDDRGDPKAWRRMRREARLLRLLGEHPHIANIDHVFIHPPHEGTRLAYLQMPFYEGGNLLEWLTSRAPEINVVQSVMAQVADALAFTHNNGVVHADVKLENVLMDAHGVPHLCDFEFSQTQAFTQSTVAGFGTLDYVAPEVRTLGPGEQLQPSADMFSFGICLLFAFCDASQYARDAGGGLTRLQHENADLVELVRSSLQLNPDARPSAVEVTRSAFLDPVRLFERANEQMEAAKEEEDRVEQEARSKAKALREETARVKKQAAATARKLRQEEAAMRKKLEDDEAEAQDRIIAAQAKVDRERRTAERKQRQLEKEELELKEKEKNVKIEKSSLKAERDRVAALKKDAKKDAEEAAAAVKKMEQEKAKLDKIKAEKIRVPNYWTSKDFKSTGFKMEPVEYGDQLLLERVMNTSTWSRNSGQTPYDANPYSHLALAKAWRCENHTLWKKYSGAKDQVRAEVAQLRKKGIASAAVTTAMSRNAGDLKASLDSRVNETYVVHGTHSELIPKLLAAGTNSRYTQRAYFGYGTYFGDDAKTSDHYQSGMDTQLGQFPNLHELIYADHASHPNSGRDQTDKGIHYMLICRLVMGKVSVLKGRSGSVGSTNTDNAQVYVQNGARPLGELSTVPGSNPPIHYHSLFAAKPDGQREIVTFHDENVYPEYLVAYYRTNKVMKEHTHRIWLLKQQVAPLVNMRIREDVQLIIAHTMIWAANCAVAGGFVRDFVINNEPSNDVDVLLTNGVSLESAKRILDTIASKYGGIRVEAPRGKGSTNCAIVSSSSNIWVPIEVDLSDPTKLGKLSPPPGIDTDAGNLMFTRKGIELKIDKRGLPGVTEVIERIKRKEFVYLQDFDDKTMYGSETGGGKCKRRLEKYLERGWTCLTRVPNSVMNQDKFKRFKPLVKPDRKFEKEWWKLK
ncbi:hypothetical protein TeGR_g11050 [Tetraparma gracilis]|uniref:Protein kinase domain-containing protein n=1 Tax=Tetraparma gracilis TaxID=2962635 RepID=A0ABQ6MNJ9_9STRA|nr:hypothetical protein TeGR_g11050 [Tetraparma gracilis]